MLSLRAMPVLLIGIVFLALGISLAVAWWPAFLLALQGIVVLSLFFWGAILLLVGYSEQKAAREFVKAVSETPNDEINRDEQG
jgi:hypothetical protein